MTHIAPKPMIMQTEIFDRRSILVSSSRTMGMRTKVQSASTLMMPYKYPLASRNQSGRHLTCSNTLSTKLLGGPHWKVDTMEYKEPYTAETPMMVWKTMTCHRLVKTRRKKRPKDILRVVVVKM
jgi:hypothetical protein